MVDGELVDRHNGNTGTGLFIEQSDIVRRGDVGPDIARKGCEGSGSDSITSSNAWRREDAPDRKRPASLSWRVDRYTAFNCRRDANGRSMPGKHTVLWKSTRGHATNGPGCWRRQCPFSRSHISDGTF